MSSIVFRAVAANLRVFLAVSALAFLALAAESFAQTPSTEAPPQKVEQLLKLLDDPEVKAWIAKKNAPQPEMQMGASASDFMRWSEAVRGHLRGLRQAVPAVPVEMKGARDTIMTEINGHRPGAVLLLFIASAALGFGAEFIFRTLVSRTGRRNAVRAAADNQDLPARHHVVGRSIFLGVAPLVVFAVASLGIFLSFTWPPLLARLVLPMLVALIAWRVIMRCAAVVLGTGQRAKSPNEPDRMRLIPMDDANAVFWHRRVALFSAIFFIGWAAAGLMTALNFTPNVRSLLVYIIGLGLLAVAIETVWNRPASPATARIHQAKEWMLTFYLCLLWLLWVAGTPLLLWIGIYALVIPPVLRTTSTIMKSSFAGSESADKARNVVYEVLVERGVRAIIIALAVTWLAVVFHYHSSMMMGDENVNRIIRGVLGGIVILLGADLIWHMIKSYINRRIERARLTAGDEAELARSGRLQTLLPILRNFLAALIGAIAIMMFLSGLGVEIGPLIAGAGIFGVAIGFGSQTLVKDVISGIFYMMDDAFRVGEYIQSGSYKGTVESFSIRSVKLRHHRGPIFTVPFGSLGAVQNMSRDWVIDKFLISVNYDTDIAKVKKLVKVVGAELLADEELGPHIIETVKMKGVEAFGDYGINLSFAMMTKPGHQSTIRRRAYAMIRESFGANGIGFASPTVQVAGNEDHAASAAAAATNDAMARKKAAEAAKLQEN